VIEERLNGQFAEPLVREHLGPVRGKSLSGPRAFRTGPTTRPAGRLQKAGVRIFGVEEVVIVFGREVRQQVQHGLGAPAAGVLGRDGPDRKTGMPTRGPCPPLRKANASLTSSANCRPPGSPPSPCLDSSSNPSRMSKTRPRPRAGSRIPVG